MRLNIKRVVSTLAVLLVLLAVTAFVVLSLPPFGGKITGARLERVRANPQFENGAFVNVQRQAPSSIAALGGYLVGQMQGEPIRRAAAAAKAQGVDRLTPRVGQVLDAERASVSDAWWESVR